MTTSNFLSQVFGINEKGEPLTVGGEINRMRTEGFPESAVQMWVAGISRALELHGCSCGPLCTHNGRG